MSTPKKNQSDEPPLFPVLNEGNDRNKKTEMQNFKSENTQENQSQNSDSEDLKQLLEIFNKYDKNQKGIILITDVLEILKFIGKDTQEIEPQLKKQAQKEGQISFDEFLGILAQIEYKGQNTQNQYVNFFLQEKFYILPPINLFIISHKKFTYNYQPNQKILEFLKLLDDYRKKCEGEKNYSEAKKAHLKIQEVMDKEALRQRHNLKLIQENEILELENNQRNQFVEFTNAWDNFMNEYESTAYTTLEKLKEKQSQEYQDYLEKLKEEHLSKIKFSKHLIEYRFKEQMLVKLKKYQEAENLQKKADFLEKEEKEQKELEVMEKIEMKLITLKKHHQANFQALLKRIQSDRTKQLKQRQDDSKKLIIKNRNIRNELIHKHNQDSKKITEQVQNLLNFQQVYQYSSQFSNQNFLQNFERKILSTNSNNHMYDIKENTFGEKKDFQIRHQNYLQKNNGRNIRSRDSRTTQPQHRRENSQKGQRSQKSAYQQQQEINLNNTYNF